MDLRVQIPRGRVMKFGVLTFASVAGLILSVVGLFLPWTKRDGYQG
jgi:hypothetical protein